jgi:hypothetical protein
LACVKRVAPSAVEDRTVTSGIPTTFGSSAELPEGVRIQWDFGDGTPPVDGPVASHAFPRSGTFTVTQTVLDPDGQKRSTSAKATVLRRSVPSALPGDARAALIQEMPWRRMALHRETATRLGMRDVFDDTARALSDALGFDATSEEAAAAHGFDPEEGVALYTVADDPEALVGAVGTSDDAKALASVKRLLAHEGGSGRFAGGPFQLSESSLDGTPVLLGTGRGGEKVGVLQRYGYLYLRLPGMSDPAPALRGALKVQLNAGLFADSMFQAAVRHVGTGDMVFFSRGTGGSQGRFAAVGLSAFTVIDRKDLLEMRFFAQPRDLSVEVLQKTFTPLKAPPDLAAKLPPGPAAYVKLSGEPAAMWRELLRWSAADAGRVKERVKELTGLDLEKDLLPSFTGNVGIGVYLDSFALLDAILGEQVASLDRSGVLAVAELQPGKGQPLASAIDARVRPDRRFRIAEGATVWKLGENVAEVAVQGDFLYLSLGGEQSQQGAPAEEKPSPPSRRGRRGKEKPPPAAESKDLGRLGAALSQKMGAHSLADDLKADGLRGFELPTHQIAWLDVRGVVRSIQAAAQEHGGVLGAGTRLVAERFGSVRDVLFEARPAPDGVQAQLFVRFGPGRSGGRGSDRGQGR